MAFCHQCGAPVTPTAFCPKCGAERRHPPEASSPAANSPVPAAETPAARRVEKDLVASPAVPAPQGETVVLGKPSQPDRHLRVVAAVVVVVLVVLGAVLLNGHVGGSGHQNHQALAALSPVGPSSLATPSSVSSDNTSTRPTASAPAVAAPGASASPQAQASGYPSPAPTRDDGNSAYAVGPCSTRQVRLTESDAAKCLLAAWVRHDMAGARNYATPNAVDALFGLRDRVAKPTEYTFRGCIDGGSKSDVTGYYSAYVCQFGYSGHIGCSYCVLHFDVKATAALGASVTRVTGDSGD